MTYLILTASYSSSISTLAFDPAKGTLKLVSSTVVGHHPSWITFYPGDHSVVFTGLEQADGKILALKYDKEGRGEVVTTVASGGRDPCSLVVLTKPELLFVANYSSGIVSSLPVSRTAPYILGSAPSAITELTGTGPNTSRQEASHPHQVVIHDDQSGKELLVPDLGADRVQRFTINGDGSLVNVGSIEYEPGSGPRHLVVHEGHLFTLHELTSVLSKRTFPPPSSSGPSALISSVSTLSSPQPTPSSMLAAEILIPKPNASFPTAYIYVSNRNDPHPERDTIAIFDPKTMEMVGEVRTGLQHLRGMVFGGEDERWLVAGGAQGGGIKIFERVNGGKGLKEIAKTEEVEAPTGFLWK